MSLINQMLKDLENRSKSTVEQKVALSGLFPADSIDNDSNSKIVNSAIVFLFLTFMFLIGFTFKTFFAVHTNNHPVTKYTRETSNNIVLEPQVEDAIKMVTIHPSVLSNIQLEVADGYTYMHFILNKETQYAITSNPRHTQIILMLDHTSIVNDLPSIDYLKSAIEGMEMTNDINGNLKIKLAISRKAEIKKLDMETDSNGAQLLLTIFSPIKNNVDREFTIKKTKEFNVQQQYQTALKLSEIGEILKAEIALNQIMNENPNFFLAKQSLIEMLIRHGQLVKAKQLLEVSLAKQPSFPPLVQLKAQILLKEGKTEQALSLLEGVAPSLDLYPEYHAFIAALYQQKGQSMLARKLYEQLVQKHPEKAIWWMGLGIALENLGHLSQAKQVYIRASHLEGLNPETSAFLQTRISSI